MVSLGGASAGVSTLGTNFSIPSGTESSSRSVPSGSWQDVAAGNWLEGWKQNGAGEY